MPILALEVPETYDNITRPVTHGIVRDLMDRLDVPRGIKILYPGVAGVNPQRGTSTHRRK